MKALVMVFSGEYDLACKDELRAEFERLVPVPNLVLDFSGVRYMDSTAITELIRFHKARAELRFEPEIIVLQDANMQKLFDLLHLGEAFKLAGSLDEVLGEGVEAKVEYAFSLDGGDAAPVDHWSDSSQSRSSGESSFA